MSSEQEQQEQPVRLRGQRNPLTSAANAQNALLRGLEVLQEGETNEESEEIRKLDSQLDHLNDYVTKMEKRLQDHNERLMETLKQQKEEREKRRRSFHERMTQVHQEDNDFQQQLSAILGRVDKQRNRQSIYEMIQGMEIPKVDDEEQKSKK